MSFSREFVVAITRGIPSPETVRGIGQNESSVHAQHTTAIEFWRTALTPKSDDAVQPNVRAFALEEIARHRAAIDGTPYMSPEDKRRARALT